MTEGSYTIDYTTKPPSMFTLTQAELDHVHKVQSEEARELTAWWVWGWFGNRPFFNENGDWLC